MHSRGKTHLPLSSKNDLEKNMKVLKNSQKDNIVGLEIEVSQDTLEKAFDNAFKKVVKHAKIAGFRKGKVPRSLFEKEYGKEHIVKEGIPEAVNIAYLKAIQELNLQIIDYPKDVKIEEYKENHPLLFSCNVEVQPEVKLGKYKGLKATKEPESAAEEALRAELEKLRDQYAEFQTATRACQENDIIRLHIDASIDGEPLTLWTRQNAAIKLGNSNFGAEFDKELMGLAAEATKEFTITYTDDFATPEVQGKAVAFKTTLVEVREKNLPEMNDELAKKVSQGKQETVDALKESIRVRLNAKAKEDSEIKLKTDLIDQVVEDSQCIVPEVLVKQDIDQKISEYRENMKRSGFTLEQYIGMTGQNMEEFRAGLKADSEKQVKTELVLNALAKELNIKYTEEDLIEEYKKLLPEDKRENVLKYFKSINQAGFENMLRQRKTIDFLVENAKITEK